MNNQFEVTFPMDALPGVFAIGTIRRGQSIKVDAAEAVRLVDVKGLAFANPDDAATARAAVASAKAATEAAAPAAPAAATVTETAAAEPAATTEEH